MDGKFMIKLVVLDGNGKVGERIDFLFTFAPGLHCQPWTVVRMATDGAYQS